MPSKSKYVTHTESGLSSKIISFFNKYHFLWLFIIFAVFYYLRYANVMVESYSGFDQARDAFQARNILHGNWTFQGPWTGNGHLHIGPLYFYLLAIVFKIFNLDPFSANYLNILLNVFNFWVLYFVFSRLFSRNWGLVTVLMYSLTEYYIRLNQIAWNVSSMVGLAALIFYSLLQVYNGKPKWIYATALFSGLYFHAHYTAMFLPIIVPLSLLLVQNRKDLAKHMLFAAPLYLVWFIPNIIGEILNVNGDAGRYREFVQYFLQSFHLRFFIYRFPYHFILIGKSFSVLSGLLEVVVPLLYAFFILFREKSMREKQTAFVIAVFFLVPVFAFTLFKGTLSEYYYLHTTPAVFYMLIYLMRRLLKINFRWIGLALAVFWLINFTVATKSFWVKHDGRSWQVIKAGVRSKIEAGSTISFDEGQMDSYLYTIWKDDGIRF